MAYHDALTGLANRAKLEEHAALALARARRQDRSAARPLHRPRPLQARQRHARPRRRRRAAAPGRGAAGRAHARDRPARPPRRRRVHAPARRPRRRRPRDRRPRRARRCWRRSSSRSRSKATSSRSPPASASRPSRTTAPRWPTCSSAPTPRSTRPSATAAGRSASPRAEQAPATGQLTLDRPPAPRARARRVRAALPAGLRVATGEAVAVEALLRWNDPERGMVAPGEFIPAAEDSGLIEPIGDWVVDAVIAQAARWRELGLRPDIAFNVSPRQLRSRGFADRLLARLEGVDASQFIAEITESAAMADPEHTVPLLERLAAAGLRLAIDDFGADFSSLARLRDLPVHELKIDRSFLREVPSDGRSSAIVTAIVQLAQALELSRSPRASSTPTSSSSSPTTAARSPRASISRGRCRPRRSPRCFSPRWRAGSRRPCRRASRGSGRAARRHQVATEDRAERVPVGDPEEAERADHHVDVDGVDVGRGSGPSARPRSRIRPKSCDRRRVRRARATPTREVLGAMDVLDADEADEVRVGLVVVERQLGEPADRGDRVEVVHVELPARPRGSRRRRAPGPRCRAPPCRRSSSRASAWWCGSSRRSRRRARPSSPCPRTRGWRRRGSPACVRSASRWRSWGAAAMRTEFDNSHDGN